MLRWRIVSGVVVGAIILGLAWVDFHHNYGRPGIWLASLALVLASASVEECVQMLTAKNLQPTRWVTHAGAVLVVGGAVAPLIWSKYPTDCPVGKFGWPLIGLAAATALILAEEIRTFRPEGGGTRRAAAGVLIVTVIGLAIAFLAALRFFDSNARGMTALLSMIIVAKLGDMGAYFAGRFLGRTKLAPTLSPKKTVEGLVGGLIAACLGSWGFFYFLAPLITETPSTTPWWGAVVYGLALAAAGALGDLAFSMLKRDSGAKDSGSLLPGMGGLADLMDSIYFAAPPAFCCWAVGLVEPLS